MLDKIKANLSNPEILENLYRGDRKNFRAAFDSIYPEIESSEPAKFWKARLEYDNKPDLLKAISSAEILTVLVVCLITAFLIRIPALFQSMRTETVFYEKNAAIIVFLGLTLYTLRIFRISDTRKI